MSRISLVPDDAVSPETGALFEMARARYDKVPNLFRTLAHQPQALGPLMQLFGTLYDDSPLDKRLIELGIIVISFQQRSQYCLTLHKAFALEQGATTEEIRMLRDGGSYDAFPPHERAVLRYAAAFADEPLAVDDAFYAELQAHFDEPAIVNLSFLLGMGLMFGQIANALRIPQDAITLPKS